MSDFDRQKGAARPLWIGVAVITCVVFGSTINKCLSCFAPDSKAQPVAQLPVRGERMDAPATVEPEEKPLVSATVADWGDPVAVEPAAQEPAAPVKKKAPENLGDFLDITFDKLASYVYEFQEEGEDVKPKKDQIPENIKKLQDKKIAIKGFMIPLKNDGEDVVEFVLVRNQGACCWGIVPRMNEWIHVKMEPEKVSPYAVDVPITVFGTLDIGEVYENGLLMSIYRMESNKVVEPELFK